MAIFSYFAPAVMTATRPRFTREKRFSHCSLIRCSSVALTSPGYEMMPPGIEAFSNSSADAFCALSPSIEASPLAKIGGVPTSGWNRQFIRS